MYAMPFKIQAKACSVATSTVLWINLVITMVVICFLTWWFPIFVDRSHSHLIQSTSMFTSEEETYFKIKYNTQNVQKRQFDAFLHYMENTKLSQATRNPSLHLVYSFFIYQLNLLVPYSHWSQIQKHCQSDFHQVVDEWDKSIWFTWDNGLFDIAASLIRSSTQATWSLKTRTN